MHCPTILLASFPRIIMDDLLEGRTDIIIEKAW